MTNEQNAKEREREVQGFLRVAKPNVKYNIRGFLLQKTGRAQTMIQYRKVNFLQINDFLHHIHGRYLNVC